jgi:hypothetical protein
MLGRPVVAETISLSEQDSCAGVQPHRGSLCETGVVVLLHVAVVVVARVDVRLCQLSALSDVDERCIMHSVSKGSQFNACLCAGQPMLRFAFVRHLHHPTRTICSGFLSTPAPPPLHLIGCPCTAAPGTVVGGRRSSVCRVLCGVQDCRTYVWGERNTMQLCHSKID